MKNNWTTVGLALGGLVGAGVAWRIASRRQSLPCPSWLGWVLENPFMQASGDRILDEMDLRMGMRILDVGSGPGRLSLPAAERVGPRGEVVALDMQPAMLQRLDNRAQARKLRNIRLVLGKAGSGLLARDYFDRALLVTVLGEIPAPLAALREIYLALKPGGFLTVTEMIPDPHYQTKAVVERMAVETGFQTSLGSSSKLGYSMRLYKPLAHSGEAMI